MPRQARRSISLSAAARRSIKRPRDPKVCPRRAFGFMRGRLTLPDDVVARLTDEVIDSFEADL